MDPIEIINLIRSNPNLSFTAIKDMFGKLVPETSLKEVYDSVRGMVSTVKSYAESTSSDQAMKDMAMAGGLLGAAVVTIKTLPDILGALDGSKGFTEMSQELISMGDTLKSMENPNQIIQNIGKMVAGQAITYMQQQSALIDHMNAKVGLTGKLSENFRSEITKASPEVLRMGIGFKDLAVFAGDLTEKTGKFLTMSSEGMIRSASVAQAYVGSLGELSEMLPEFQKVGYGFTDTVEHIGKIGKDSMEVGLRAQTVSKNIGENIGKLNEYGFKKGVDGLGKMAQKAIEFRTSMSDVFNIADKTMDITDSINMSAELIALGGAVGDFLDPFKLSYMAVNDVGGLQDALLGMSQSLATYNNETNKYEVTGVNLRLAREQARALGVDMKTLTNSAIAGAERQSVHNDLMARGIVMSKESEQFVTNISQMKDGKMVIEVGGDLEKKLGMKQVAIDSMTQAQFQLITDMQNDIKQKDETGIIRDQASNVMIIQRDLSFLAALARNAAGDRLSKDAEVTLLKQLDKYGFGKEGASLKEKSEVATNKYAPQVAPLVNKTIDDGKELINRATDGIQKGYDSVKANNSTSTSSSQTIYNYGTPTPNTRQPKQNFTFNVVSNLDPRGVLQVTTQS